MKRASDPGTRDAASPVDLAAAAGETWTRARDGLGAAGLVKICGLRAPEHARAAVGAGADLLGFIFAPARRQVTPDQARTAIAAARDAAATRCILAVGVFVDASVEEMNDTADAAGLDLLQLHGDEPAALLAELTRPVVKAVRPPAGTSLAEIEARFADYSRVVNAPVAFLVDGFAAHAAGGAGVRADWALAADIARCWPVILAGGLDPANVGVAIATVAPFAVDVSSGVETDGTKDGAKIAAFVAAAKRAFTASR